jgi:hypothetical protein
MGTESGKGESRERDGYSLGKRPQATERPRPEVRTPDERPERPHTGWHVTGRGKHRKNG